MKWEYLFRSDIKGIEDLNELGELGWELISHVIGQSWMAGHLPFAEFIFKRPKQLSIEYA